MPIINFPYECPSCGKDVTVRVSFELCDAVGSASVDDMINVYEVGFSLECCDKCHEMTCVACTKDTGAGTFCSRCVKQMQEEDDNWEVHYAAMIDAFGTHGQGR